MEELIETNASQENKCLEKTTDAVLPFLSISEYLLDR